MNIQEFKNSTYDRDNIEEVECKRTSKGVVKHPYENIHQNWRKYVNAYFERLNYIKKDFNFIIIVFIQIVLMLEVLIYVLYMEYF